MSKRDLITNLSAEFVREVLDYDPETGIFTWRWRNDQAKPWNARYAGTVAGNLSINGYIVLRINQRPYQAHRLAWLHVHGVWPTNEIDHINGDRADNRANNLREATNQENQRNSGLQRNNSTGVVGVHWYKRSQKYQAHIKVDGKRIFLGYFSTLEEAATARAAAEIKYFGEFRNQTSGRFVPEYSCYATNLLKNPAGSC